MTRCSQCTYPMRLVEIKERDPNTPHYFSGAFFECTHCEQHAHVRPDGSGTMTLVNIAPAPKTAKDHHAAADYWADEKLMFLGLRCAAGYITRQEYDEMRNEIVTEVERYKGEHPLPPPTLWNRLRGRA